MGKKLTNNLGLKIGSVLFAAVLWLLVTNINNPSTPIYFTNVPVQIINANLITSQGKMYEILEDTDVIESVTLMVPRSMMDSMSSEDNIVAIADMNNLTNLNTIHIEISTKRNQASVSSIKTSNDILKLNIEDKKNISIPLTTTTSGSLQEGYIVGNVTPDQNLVRVSGPESIVSKIKSAEVNVSVTGFTSDIGTSAEIKLYDAKGNEVAKDKLTLNINNVGVKVEILATKSIPLRFSASGVPAYVEKEAIKTFTISSRNIAVRNLPAGYKAEVSAYEEEFPIQIRGLAEDVNAVDVNQLNPNIDINSLLETGVLEKVAEGYYDVKLSVELPEAVELRENITVRLTITEEDQGDT